MTMEAFIREFQPFLGNTSRWSGIEEIATRLYALQRNVSIVETGCARQLNNWSGDGMSTQLWSFIIDDIGGTATSIDISEQNIAFARTIAPNVNFICGDSIIKLRQIEEPENIDLLYLDSYDFDGTSDAAFHNACELSSIYPRLRSGCIIAIDDCITPKLGKHLLSSALLNGIDVQPAINGYVSVWQKR